MGLPVKFIGVGETAEDLQPFDPEVGSSRPGGRGVGGPAVARMGEKRRVGEAARGGGGEGYGDQTHTVGALGCTAMPLRPRGGEAYGSWVAVMNGAFCVPGLQ